MKELSSAIGTELFLDSKSARPPYLDFELSPDKLSVELSGGIGHSPHLKATVTLFSAPQKWPGSHMANVVRIQSILHAIIPDRHVACIHSCFNFAVRPKTIGKFPF